MAEVELRRRLQRLVGRPISLVITDNRSSMVYVTPGRRGLVCVRVHHMFLDAPPDVVKALAQFVRQQTPDCHRALNAYIRGNAHRIGGRPRHRASINLSHKGFQYDLREIYDRLNRQYFEGRLRVRITWGKSNHRNRRYSIDFGCFDIDKRIIRINPALDRPFVPGFFVDYIVYHEMLHAAIGIREAPNGRRTLHSARFLEEEKQFRFYRSALRWQSANLWRFLRAA